VCVKDHFTAHRNSVEPWVYGLIEHINARIDWEEEIEEEPARTTIMTALDSGSMLRAAKMRKKSPIVGKHDLDCVPRTQWNEAFVKATTDANDYCTKQGKKTVINHMDTAGTQVMSSSTAQVQFSCYSEGDQQYRQAVLLPYNGTT
jgi:hypothetical protein